MRFCLLPLPLAMLLQSKEHKRVSWGGMCRMAYCSRCASVDTPLVLL